MNTLYAYTAATLLLTTLITVLGIYLIRSRVVYKKLSFILFGLLMFFVAIYFTAWWPVLISPLTLSIFIYDAIPLWAAILFFASASTLLSQDKKRALNIFISFLVLFSASQTLLFVYPLKTLANNFPQSNGVLLQSTSFTCAPSSASILLNKYNIRIDEQTMSELSFTRAGFGANSIGVFHAVQQNLESTPYKNFGRIEALSFDEIKYLGLPVVVYTNLTFPVTHAVVVESYSDEIFTVIDPLKGRHMIDEKDFKKIITNKPSIYIDAPIPE